MNTRYRSTLVTSLVALFAATLTGCSGNESTSGNGNVGSSAGTLPDYGYGGAESGGANSAQGGTRAATGGTSAEQSTSSSTTAGANATGGTAAATGGAPVTGGRSSAATTGGTRAAGGSQGTGGAKQTGGAQNAGGTANSGGTRPSGGTSSTGGNPASGGTRSPVGGTSSTGGSGTKATGGSSSSGGTSAAAGSSSTGFDWATNTYNPTGGQNVGHQGHHTGEGCLSSCHSHSFTVGGTVYQSNGTSTASNVEIGVVINGTLYTGYSGSQGNFYFSGVPSSANWGSAQIAIRTSTGTAVHPTTSGLSGNCNSCHGSSNRIVVP